MPKFTDQELEEIKQNTERVEKERRAKTGSGGKGSARANKSKSETRKPRTSRSSSDEVASFNERLIGPFLLILTLVISYVVMRFTR